MHIITEIKEFSKAKIRYLFKDDTCLTLYKGMYNGDGEIMEDKDYDSFLSEMIAYGKKRAMNLLVKKSYSRRALEKKLEDDGYDPIIILKIFEFLDSYHYLNDEALAESLIMNNKAVKSKAEIRFLLKKREISDEVAEKAMEEYYVKDEDDQEDQNPELKAVIRLLKKINMTPDKIAELDFKEKQKLAARFYRKGFKSDVISKALKLEIFE